MYILYITWRRIGIFICFLINDHRIVLNILSFLKKCPISYFIISFHVVLTFLLISSYFGTFNSIFICRFFVGLLSCCKCNLGFKDIFWLVIIVVACSFSWVV